MKLYLLAFFTFYVSLTIAQCPSAPVTLSTQAQVNNFPVAYPGCTNLPVGVDLTVRGNDITNLNALSVLHSIGGVLEIKNNPLLTSISGLSNVTSSNGLIIRNNTLLPSLNGLNNITTVGDELTIRENPLLTNLAGLNNISTAANAVIIRDNAHLTSLDGLNNLLTVGDILEIINNPLLTNVQALANVTSIGGGIEGGLIVDGNNLLTTLNGLGNGSTSIGAEITITNNPVLSGCSVASVCKYLSSPSAIATISLNTINCNSVQEVKNGCAMLPVKLAYFRAKYNGDINVLIDWASLSEEGSNTYTVEHSVDGQRFTELYRTSNGNTVKKYTYSHATLSSTNYYRLKIVDQSASITYSNIVFVRLQTANDIAIYPNPAKQSIRITNNRGDQLSYSLYNSTGNKILKGKTNETSHSLNTNNLHAGIYILAITKDDLTTYKKVIIQ
jgi:hypothetical protein